MKVTQETPDTFKPVTITLETREELDALIDILAYAAGDFDHWSTRRRFAADLLDSLPSA